MTQDTEPTQKPAPRTPLCPLCQHNEFQPILLNFGEGHAGRWIFPADVSLLTEFLPEKMMPVKALRCMNCFYILFFAAEWLPRDPT